MSLLRDVYKLPRASLYPDVGGAWNTLRPFAASAYRQCLAVSADGMYVIYGDYGGRLYVSADGGYTWTERQPAGGAVDLNWRCCAMSASGQYMLAGIYGDLLYTSANYGVTWTERQPAGAVRANWTSCAMSADGSVMMACASGGRVWVSTNSGVNWTDEQPSGDENKAWSAVACDADGSVMAAGATDATLYITANSGGSWAAKGSWTRYFYCLAMSADGSVILGGQHDGGLRLSVDTGENWTEPRPAGDVTRNWYCVAVSSDGSIRLAGASTGRFYAYAHATWVEKRPAGNADGAWRGAAMTSDGSQYFAAYYGGGLYSSRTVVSDAVLPSVYGDLTDGTAGIWELPCIEPSSYTYAYAGHAVMSAANGNTVTVYSNGVEVESSGYTFNEANDFRGLGAISTITFTSDQGTAVITARGKGKATGAVLMENIIDIIDDVLTVESDFTSSVYDATSKALTSQVFASQGYTAAGVVITDRTYWDLITEMMASFLGSAYINGAGKLSFEIDDGTISSTGAPIIPRGDVKITDIKQRLVNVINQCPANYAYNYSSGEFGRETDDSAYADAGSQLVYGTMKPDKPYQFYWCRDLTSVQAIQAIIVGKFARPVYEIEFENAGMKPLGIDIGDIFAMTVDTLYDTTGSPLYNQYWKVVSVSPDFRRGAIRFRALWTPYYMTIGGARDTTIY